MDTSWGDEIQSPYSTLFFLCRRFRPPKGLFPFDGGFGGLLPNCSFPHSFFVVFVVFYRSPHPFLPVFDAFPFPKFFFLTSVCPSVRVFVTFNLPPTPTRCHPSFHPSLALTSPQNPSLISRPFVTLRGSAPVPRYPPIFSYVDGEVNGFFRLQNRTFPFPPLF